MTPEQRAERIHHHMYDTCEGILEHAERIVALEELVADLWHVYDYLDVCRRCPTVDECELGPADEFFPCAMREPFEKRLRELEVPL